MVEIWYVGLCNVGDVGCLEFGMLRMWNAWDVGCWGCKMFVMWDVGDVECWDKGCSGCGMWDVSCLPGCEMLIYKMYHLKDSQQKLNSSHLVFNL